MTKHMKEAAQEAERQAEKSEARERNSRNEERARIATACLQLDAVKGMLNLIRDVDTDASKEAAHFIEGLVNQMACKVYNCMSVILLPEVTGDDE